jgi:hypothetical protein
VSWVSWAGTWGRAESRIGLALAVVLIVCDNQGRPGQGRNGRGQHRPEIGCRASARGSWRGAETVTALRGLPDVMGDRATLCLCAHRRPRNAAARLCQWWQEVQIEI